MAMRIEQEVGIRRLGQVWWTFRKIGYGCNGLPPEHNRGAAHEEGPKCLCSPREMEQIIWM